MAAQKFNFSYSECGNSVCEQGATFSYELHWEKELIPDTDIFSVVDMTGFTARMQVRKDVGKPLLIELSTSNGRIIIDEPNGKINLLIAASVTSTLIAGVYKYDLELTNTSGFVDRFIEGLFEVVGQITV
jgi:hypothetical protein